MVLTAKQLIKRYGTNNPFDIAQYLDYIVLFVPLVKIRGFYHYVKRNHIIYIDENLSEEESRFVCSHELAHSILHRGYNRVFLDSGTFFINNCFENEADRWAAELLLTDDDLKEYLFCNYTIEQIAFCSGISPELVKYRVENFK